MRIETVKVRRLYLQVAEQLSNLISSGEIDPGSRLPSERDLAVEFGVSRPTVREAMIALEIAGLVEIRSGSGVYVVEAPVTDSPSDPEEAPGPLEILEARRLIEGECAALAASHTSPETLSTLSELLATIASENASTLEKEAADQEFHETIAATSGNSALHSIICWLWSLRNQSEISQRFHERLRSEGSTPVVRDHQAILDALENKQGELARHHVHKHLQRVLDESVNADIQ